MFFSHSRRTELVGQASRTSRPPGGQGRTYAFKTGFAHFLSGHRHRSAGRNRPRQPPPGLERSGLPGIRRPGSRPGQPGPGPDPGRGRVWPGSGHHGQGQGSLQRRGHDPGLFHGHQIRTARPGGHPGLQGSARICSAGVRAFYRRARFRGRVARGR